MTTATPETVGENRESVTAMLGTEAPWVKPGATVGALYSAHTAVMLVGWVSLLACVGAGILAMGLGANGAFAFSWETVTAQAVMLFASGVVALAAAAGFGAVLRALATIIVVLTREGS